MGFVINLHLILQISEKMIDVTGCWFLGSRQIGISR
jgi:hypothetical protein